MKLTLENTERGLELHQDGSFVAEVAVETDGEKIVGLINSAHELAASIQYYFSVLDEVTGKAWRERPDHVQQKMLEAQRIYFLIAAN